jgi:hypothetical protein
MDRSDTGRVLAMDTTVANKIRALDAAGLSRPEIARLLNKRPQHVRNVLEDDKRYGRRPREPMPETGPPHGFAETARSYKSTALKPTEAGLERDVEDRGGGAYRLVVREDGSVLLPEAVRDAFGLHGRGAVVARLEGDEFKLLSVAAGLRRAQERLRPYMIEGESWADSLIADRRREAAREESDG